MKKIIFVLIITISAVILATVSKGNAKEKGTMLVSEESICAYLKQYGWETDTDRITYEDIVIPCKFNDVYVNYNSIQKQQGFDLSAHAGNKAVLVTCPVTNCALKTDVYAELILEDTLLIGADLTYPGEDGAIRPINSR